MQEREHTQKELDKLNACRDFLKQNGVFDQDSFIDFLRMINYETEDFRFFGGTQE